MVVFTRRTNDPKLGWLERRLVASGIASQRDGKSFHAPILEVPEECLNAAWVILDEVDDVPDDDPMFVQGGVEGPEDLGPVTSADRREFWEETS